MSASVAGSPAGPPRVVIIGGGITGLAAAWELEGPSRSGALGVDLFESSDRVGGPIRSDVTSGHVLEGGPDCFLSTKPGAIELCEELGLSGSLIGVRPSAGRAFIYRDGRLHRIPALLGPGRRSAVRALASTTLFSRAGKFRMLAGGALVWLRPIHADDRSALGPQLRSRFGDEAVDWMLEPLVSGVHPAPLEILSASAVAGVLPSRWVVGRSPPTMVRPPSPGPVAPGSPPSVRLPAGPFLSLREGLEQLPRTLAAQLSGAAVHLRTRVREVRPEGERYAVALDDGRNVLADGVVFAVPPPVASQLLAGGFPTAAGHLKEIRMESLGVVGAVFDRSDVPLPLDGSGILVPRRSGLPVSAFTWLSAKWDRPGAGPEEIALRVFLRSDPGRTDPPSEAEWLALAREGLRAVMGITAAPRFATVFAHRAALAWYEVGHVERVREVRRILGDGSGVELAGASYDGLGIPDAIRSGREAARRIRARVERRSPPGLPKRPVGEPLRSGA